MLLSKGAIEGKEILNSPVASLIIGYPSTINLSRVSAVDTSTSKATTLRGAIVQTDIDAVAQTFNPWALYLTEEGVVSTDSTVLIHPLILIALNDIFGNYYLLVGRKVVETFQVAIGIVRT